ncbi:MAG: cobaltochelatase subunit CobN [Candidatus Lokiarchaeota archaeon]|nr:cobaltochelatase subunit CobN [Candidatus Lokiarchaeota archaeon]
MSKISIDEKDIPKITLVTATVFMKWMNEGIKQIYGDMGKVFSFKSYFLNDINTGKISQENFIKTIFESDVMLIDIRGHCLAAEILENTYEKMEKENPELFAKKEIITLIGGNPVLMRLTKIGSFMGRKIPKPKKGRELDFEEIPDLTEDVLKGIKMDSIMRKFSRILPIKSLKHMKNWVYIRDYWTYGLAGIAENHKNLLLFILKKYLGFNELHKIPKPLKIPDIGIYNPMTNEYFESLDNYLKKTQIDLAKQTIGLFFYGTLYFEQSLPIIKEYVKLIQENGLNVIPVFSETLSNIEAHDKFFFRNNRNLTSAVFNFQYFQLNGGPFGGDSSRTLDLYKKLNIPHFNPIIQFDVLLEEYRQSKEGSNPINQVISIVMPELDGRIEMMTVGCMHNLGHSEEIDSDVLEVRPITPNIEFSICRAKKWLDLRLKENSEKKIAILIYNYPPSEDKIGNAAYLDVSESINYLIDVLIKEGYQIDKLPKNKNLSDIFIEKGILNNAKYTNADNFDGMLWSWEEYLVYFNQLPKELRDQIIEHWGNPPGKINVLKDSFKLPIVQFNNLYIALQPARSMVSGDSNEYHDKELPPHHQYIAFYRYLEQILKVDSVIHFGTHGTIEFLPGKQTSGGPEDSCINLLGSLPNLYYYHVTNTSESAIAKRRGNAVIVNHATSTFKNSELYQELAKLELMISDYQKERESNSIEATDSMTYEKTKQLENEISDMAENLNLNTSSINELEDLLYQYKTAVIPMGLHVLGKDYTLEEKRDIISYILQNSAELPHQLRELIVKLEMLDNDHPKILEDYLLEISVKSTPSSETFKENGLTSEEYKVLKEWVDDFLVKIEKSLEVENLVRGLEGGYIEPGLGGDPIRSPTIFPTGRNSYGFDPRLVPSSTASLRGGVIADKLIENYLNEHGSYPETTSVVLWAFETMKTGGETIGQIFNYLGVRPKKERSVWTTELEIVSLEEMNHPRINVLVTICGIFRDTFPYILDVINEAIEIVQNLDEPIDKNFVRKSLLELEEKGVEQPGARVYGPAPGRYNTNLTEIISAGVWGEEKELADDYINCMSFAYMKNQRVEKISETFLHNINKIEIMSQVRDSTEYHITDLDHYFEFTGGLARAYKELNGKQATVYIADTTKRDIMVKPIEESVKESAVTRSLNPRWIKSMLTHKYHGGQKVAERVENFLGLAATTNSVDQWIWDKAYNQYIENEEIKDALIENNRFSMLDIIKNMLQAENRGYWSASDEQINNLRKLYLELENWIETTY